MPAQNTWTDPGYSHFIRAHLPLLTTSLTNYDMRMPRVTNYRDSADTGLPLKRRLEWELHRFPASWY